MRWLVVGGTRWVGLGRSVFRSRGGQGRSVVVALLGLGAVAGVVLVRRLDVPPGLVGGVCAPRAGPVAPGWPWCPGEGWFPRFLRGVAVRRRWAAGGGRCSQVGAAVWGGGRWWWDNPCWPWCFLRACLAPCGSMGAHGGPNVVGPCSGGGGWCSTVCLWWLGCACCVWQHGIGENGGKGWCWW